MTAIAGISGLGAVAKPELVGPAGLDGGTGAAGGTGFAGMLQQKLGSVVDLQNQADSASQAVATGKSSDLAGATVAVEKASIAIDLTSSIRNKAVDAYQEIMRMQV
jgi:flagellar hook-basal body complex protein FliE